MVELNSHGLEHPHVIFHVLYWDTADAHRLLPVCALRYYAPFAGIIFLLLNCVLLVLCRKFKISDVCAESLYLTLVMFIKSTCHN